MFFYSHARRIAALLVSAGLLTANFPPVAHAAEAEGKAVRIAVEGGFPPFNYLDSKNQLQGFDVDIANAICSTAKLHCEFVVEKWNEMIPDLVAKKYDAIISSMSMSAERREKVDFSDKYYDSPSIFVARKDFKTSDLTAQGLKGVRLGVTLETAQAAYVDTFFKGANVTVFKETPKLYSGLADGTVDIILEDKLAVYDWLTNTREGSCCEFRGADIKDTTYFGAGAGIAVRKGEDQLRQTINAALATIKDDGTYDMINAKYFPFSIQ